MKIFFIIFVSLLISLYATAQDTSRHDPLFGHYLLANSAEIVFLRDFRGSSPLIALSQRLFDFLPDGRIAPGGSTPSYTNSRELSTTRWMDAVACDVNGDGKDELINAWASPSNLFNISVSSTVSPMWDWNENILYGSGDTTVAGPIRLVAANLDSIPGQEIIACYLVNIGGAPDGFMISLFDSIDQATGQLVKYGSQLTTMPIQEYDMSVGDFDGDGLDEVIFAFCYNDLGNRSLLLTVGDFPQRRQVSFWPWQPFPTEDTLWNNWKRLKVTAGDFRHRGINDAVVSVTQCKGDSGRQVFSYVSIDPQLKTFTMNISYDIGIADVPDGWTWGYGWESDALAADLNPVKNEKDGDELIVAGPNEVAVLNFNNVDLKPICKARIPFLYAGMKEPFERRRFLAVADVNADSTSDSWIPEIFLAEHPQDSTTVFQTFTVDLDPYADNEILSITRVNGSEYQLTESTRKSEIVMGDFDCDAIRLAKPKFIAKKSFYQPIVQLNVPPTHFDFLNGEVYDVCKAYGSYTSQFKVTYSETQSQTSRFSSEINSTWGISTSAGGGASLFGLKVKASVGSSYERGYYQSNYTSSTTTASQVTQSWGNDWILATICDYDLWEYPLYIGGVFRYGVLVQIPHYQYTAWFDNKDTRALDWTATHDVGNIMSYIPVNRILAQTGGKLLTSFQGINIAQQASGSWDLNLEGQNINDTLLTNKIGTDIGASVSGWGMESKLSFAYSGSDISTHTSTATRYATITVEVGEIDLTIAEASYLVIPYIYWGNNGALIIDYAVEPSVDNTGNPDLYTFWQKNYLAHSDPAFILPWRLDSLKGIASNPNLKLYCKDIRISPANPSAGDVVRITAAIHNFSLKETDGPVIVRFYLGNPASGGILISGTGGPDLSTIVPIPARNLEMVSTDWEVPLGLDNSAKIYAMIDPDNTMSEIHENNNLGFIPLRVSAITGIENEIELLIPQEYSMQQNFPNPFNPSTTIKYSIPKLSFVTIKIYDVLGSEVVALVNEEKPLGTYELSWNAKDLTSGVYFYRLQAGSFVQTRKMILLK
jgi:hypothetical protein